MCPIRFWQEGIKMKTEKIVSITMLNAFLLMLFGSFLSGCQKKTISKSGFFTTFSAQNRAPASFDEFSKIQDPKQVYIYCHLNELEPKNCFDLFVQQKLNDSKNKNIQVPQYESIQQQMDELNEKVLSLVLPKIIDVTNKRESFCEKNSKYYLNRCLHQYVNKESLDILNNFQSNKSPFNGHEYLYVQKQIELKMKEYLVQSEQDIIARKKRAL